MFSPSTNFIGKDPIQWWIGQVTDPKKGKWSNSLQKQNAKDGEHIYSHRCRVRIVGYHGNDSDLPDHKLPMAHVLLPPNVSTVAGESQSMEYQGGEVVVGFFFDGADGQQPIVFGTLFRQSYVKDKLKRNKFNAFEQTEFTPWTPPEASQNIGPHLVQTDETGNKSDKTAKTFAKKDENNNKKQNLSVAEEIVKAETNPTWDNNTACEDNELTKISNAINAFTKKMSASKNIGSVTIDPRYGTLMNKKLEIKKASIKISNSMSNLIRRGRSWVIKDTLDKVSTKLGNLTPIDLQPQVGEATKGLIDTVYCNFEKINEQLLGYLEKSLENMLGSVLDLPVCAVESFMGDMFGQINNILNTQLGSMFDQLDNISGGGISPPSTTFSKGIQFANILSNAVGCDAQKCPPNTSFDSANGVSKVSDDSFSNVLDIAKVSSLTNPLGSIKGIAGDALGGALGGALGSVAGDLATGLIGGGDLRGLALDAAGNVLPDLANKIDIGLDGVIPDVTSPKFNNGSSSSIPNVDCKTNVLKCGPPRVDFVGNTDGKGASGSAIVNTLGKVIGVAISEPGSGYVDPPTLTFVDGCKNGYGAAGYVRMENGSVADVVMTDAGHDYIPNTTETDMDGNVKEVIPDPNANYGGSTSYVTSLSDVVIENTGFGYEEGDTVTVDGGAEVELDIVEGRIVGANVKNKGFGFTNTPDLTINSDTGVLARLSPILEFTKIDNASQLADTDTPFDRNLPPESVITIIDCVTK